MLIKITKKCSMGCTHCMSDCKPVEKHMDFSTFCNAISFSNDRAGNSPIIISGGEPTEHPNFEAFIGYALGASKKPIVITTNGLWLSNNIKFAKHLEYTFGDKCILQITSDDRYYPTKINTSELINLSNVAIETKISEIYPQGRALQNNLSWSRKSSNCFNVRALAKQINNITLKDIIMNQALRGHFCTPHIDIDGNIVLGESDLCPICSNIYKTDKEIINDIINFQCHQCDFINKNLPDEYKKFVM